VTAAAAALAAGCGVLVAGCGIGASTRSESHSYSVAEPLSAVRVDTAGFDIQVTAVDSPVVRVVEDTRFNRGRPRTSHEVREGELIVKGDDCANTIGYNVCDATFRMEIPRALVVTLHSDGGDVTVHGLSATADISTDGGAVTADGVAWSSVTARSDGGDVRLRYTRPPNRVDAATNGGSVTVWLPRAAYAVAAHTGGGKNTVRVSTDPASRHTISVNSDGGDVSLLPG
jgi:hypothetical protein